MRPIKFRAWNPKRKEMFFPATLSENSQTEHVMGFGGFELMQFTGLLDKNGKEIYEGDVTNYGIVAYITDLSWDSGGSLHPGFYFENIGCDLDYDSGFYDIEVLGNKFENPELLTQCA